MNKQRGAVLVGIVALVALSACAPASAGSSSYHYGGDPYQTVTVYPSAKPDSPVAILIHGGGYKSRIGTPKQKEASSLQSMGITVFDVNYTYATPAFPQEPDDVVAAAKWAIANASSYHGDPTNVTLIGGSAGSALAALASQQLPSTIKVATLSGVMDYEADPTTVVTTALGCDATCSTAQEQAWSPTDRVTQCPASWLLFNGSDEETPLSEAQDMLTHLQSLGCQARLIVHPGTEHALAYWGDEKDAIAAFVEAR